MSQPDSNHSQRVPQGLVDTIGVDPDDYPDINANLTVKNIGGIEEATLSLAPGVTILTGENATNRTSFLTALNGVLGGTKPTVRGKSDHGFVGLSFASNLEESQKPQFHREYDNDTTDDRVTPSVSGNAFHDDAEFVDTFITLLEDNPARRAVERGEDIRDVLMRPVDSDAIERELTEKIRERDDLEERLDEIGEQIDRGPALAEKRERLNDELDEINTQIDSARDVVEEYEADQDMAEEAEDLVDELEAKRNKARTLQDEIEVLNAELDGIQKSNTELRNELVSFLPVDNITAALPDTVDVDDPENIQWDSIEWADNTATEISELNTKINELQARRDELTSLVNDLTRIVQINQNTVDKTSDILITADNSATADLDPSSRTVECWTCGSTVEEQTISERTEELQNLISKKRSDISDIETEIEETREELSTLEETKRNREKVIEQLSQNQRDKQKVRSKITEKQTELESIRDDIDELEDEVEETEELRESDLLDAYQELNELEYERGRVENNIEDVEETLNEITDLKNERDNIEDNLESVRGEIEDLRTRVADLEREAVDAFNEHMETILDQLKYQNIARVWIERKVPDTQRSGTVTGKFDLHVIRDDETGAYEDTVETLSESEREVIGLVVALAGYLVHDVASEIPFMILDSVEAIDANRLVDLISHFKEHVPFLTVALLPEDAAEFPAGIDRITADELTQTSTT